MEFSFESDLPTALKIFSRFAKSKSLYNVTCQIEESGEGVYEHFFEVESDTVNEQIYGKYSNLRTESGGRYKNNQGMIHDGNKWDILVKTSGDAEINMDNIADVLLNEVIDDDDRHVFITFTEEVVRVCISEVEWGDSCTIFTFHN